ncbi:MAG: hypothetical protein HW412_1089, partial [Bacteroidetes bacterium]|nr:hypothetical protein [Bacteroidota bacterium]
MEEWDMKTRGLLIIVCVIALIAESLGAVGTWRNFTSMKEEVRSISREGSMYWAATSGGLFGWNSANDSYQLFTNSEGLQSTNLTAVGVDAQGNIWTGTSGGFIHVYSQRNKTWRYIPDIANTNQTNKQINSITILGDTVFVCTAFGLSVFRIGRFEFSDTYSRFGSLQGNTRVSVSSVVVFNDSLWLSVSDGQSTNKVAVAALSTPNLLPPESWSLRSVGDAGAAPTQLTVFNNRLYAGTNAGLYAYASGVWNVVALSGQNVIALSPSRTLLGVGTSSEAYTVDSQNVPLQVGGSLPFPAICITSDVAGQPVVGSRNGGILKYDTSWTSHAPNGPNSNSFVNIAVNIDGTVWGASGTANGKGVYRYNGKDWKSFTAENSGLPTNNYYRVSVGCDGSMWASSWHRGVFMIPLGSDHVDSSQIYGRNVGMSWTSNQSNDSNFIVITTALCDGSGNTWMSINTAEDSKIMVVQKPDNTWITLPLRVGTDRMSTLITNLTID